MQVCFEYERHEKVLLRSWEEYIDAGNIVQMKYFKTYTMTKGLQRTPMCRKNWS